jgi:selenocysteine lyase/cysteine desulfurase
VPDIAVRLGELTARVARGARALGASVQRDEDRVAHMLGVRHPAAASGALGRALATAGVYVGFRGDSVRVAPHLYNDEDDVDRLLDVLQRCAASGS